MALDGQSFTHKQHPLQAAGLYCRLPRNLSGVSVQKGQDVRTGQVIGRVAANFDGVGAIDFYMSNETSNFDPETWLRRR